MRKTYQKPHIYAESFDLVEHIAGPCGGTASAVEYFQVNVRDSEHCTFIDLYDDPNIVLFTDSDSRCNDKWPADFQYSDIKCYNNMTANYKIFAS